MPDSTGSVSGSAETLPGDAGFMTGDDRAQLGRYQLEDELGAGGMATVYRGRDLELRREVAIKVLFPHLARRGDIVARFQREARAAAALDHPNIVRVFDVGGGDADPARGARTPPYMVMELVRGCSLQELLDQRDEPPLAEVVACLGVVMAAALGEAHRAGIIHRDVKPANILVTDAGRVLLTDFGVARVEDDSSLVTRTGALLGTPAFMSPEQALAGDLDARSDVYSLGATLYRMATGATPVSGPTARVVGAISRGAFTPPLRRNPAMGAELARVIERMMAVDPEARYQSCAQAAEALDRVRERAGLDAAEVELQAFFADPAGYTAARTPAVVRATLERARDAARERAPTRAMALADRVLALEARGPGGSEGPAAREAMALVERLGRRRRRWVVVGCAVAAMALVAAVLVAARSSRGRAALAAPDAALWVSDAGPVDAAARGAAREASREPAQPDARPVDAARADRDTRPEVTPTRRSSSRRTPSRRTSSRRTPSRTSSAPPPRAAAIDAAVPDAEPVEPAPKPATVRLDIRPWCDVRIDGRDHGRVDRDRVLTLAPGRHQVVCTQGPGRARWRKTIELAPGQHLDLRGSVLEPVRVSVALGRGDQVRIQGKLHGNGATLTLTPGRYRMDIMRRGREVAGAWVSVPAVAACTVRDQPVLDCYPR